MRAILTAALLSILVTASGLAQEKSPLAVLYAGRPGGERVEDFDRFLREHFERVECIPGTELTTERAQGFDVVVCDWGRDLGLGQRPPQDAGYRLPEDFDRPVVMIGHAAGKIQKRSKIGWM